MLPATKAMPKEMLPVVDKPVIQYVLEEAVASGCDEILIVTGRGKRAIEDHFDHSFELEHSLRESGRLDVLKRVEEICEIADVHYVRQREPLGLGHAVLCGRRFVGDEPFAVLLGDDIVVGDRPATRQLLDVHEETQGSAIAAMRVPPEDVGRYGIFDVDGGERVQRVRGLVEKPSAGKAPSDLAVMGRYVLTPRIFGLLQDARPGAGGEIQLTDALSRLASEEDVRAVLCEGERLDAGDTLGWLVANVRMAMRDEGLRGGLAPALRDALGP